MPDQLAGIEDYFDEIVESDDDINEEKVNAILYTINKERDNINSITNQAQEQIDNIQSWAESHIGKHQKKIDHLTFLLNSYFLEKKRNDETIRTITFPNGSLKTRKQQPLIHISDEVLFLENAPKECVRVTTKYAPDKKAISKMLKDTGELPEGVEIEDREDKFTITTTGVKDNGQ